LKDSTSTEMEICNWCVDYLSKSLDLPRSQINLEDEIAVLGMDSAVTMLFIVELEEWLGFELPPDLALEHPSIVKLAAYLANLAPANGLNR
jgi:acyl carrier protein